jgi:Cyclin, N-terminal domain
MSRHTVSLAALCLRRYACSAPEGDWWHDLCAFVSLVLASKTHETEGHRLRMAEITHECAGNFTAAQGASMEMDMLNNLGWRLHVPTSYELCRHLVDAAYHEHQEEREEEPAASARSGDLEWQALVADAEACIDASHLWPQEPGCTAAVVAYGAAVAALRRQRHSTGALGAQDALLRRAEHHSLATSAVNACAERLFSELAVLQAPLARLQISAPGAVSAAEAAAKQKKRRSPTSIADLDTACHSSGGGDDSEEVRSLPIFFPTAAAAAPPVPAAAACGVIHRPAAVRASAAPVAAAAVVVAAGVIHRPAAVRPVPVIAAASASSSFGDCAGGSSSGASASASGLYKKMKFSESSCFTSVHCTTTTASAAKAVATSTARAASH